MTFMTSTLLFISILLYLLVMRLVRVSDTCPDSSDSAGPVLQEFLFRWECGGKEAEIDKKTFGW